MPIKLNKVRLVNWHIFGDICVSIGQMSLFAGDNGSGKSTIIDAIQYGLVADLGHIKFNSAASDRKTGRTLDSYCRGKIGADELAYIRGDCTSHVILEYSDGKKSFCAGIIIDAFNDGSRPSESPWLCDAFDAQSVPVADGTRVRTSREFREYVKSNGGSVFSSKKQYLEQLTMKLGIFRRNTEFNPYLEALVRAVSFTPLSSVDQFICNYILEDKPLDISEMKLNLENYRTAEKEANGVKTRIEKLEALAMLADDIRAENKKISLQTYLKTRIETEIAHAKIDANSAALRGKKTELEQLVQQIESAEGERRRSADALDDCNMALGKNDAHLLHNSLTQKIQDCEREMSEQSRRMERKNLLLSQVSTLLGRPLDADIESETIQVDNEKNICIEKRSEEARLKLVNEKALSEHSKELDELKKGTFRYPDSTEVLRNALESKKITSYIFADIVEVLDEEWQNAVEGWLNTQRFNVLVSEDDFQRAIEIYRSLPRSVSGVGVPDLVKMRSAKPKKGSLYDIVKANSPLAQIYAAYLLGDVMMASIETLKENSKSVTKDCMRYSSFTASRIKEDVYARWYIGKAAKEKRIAFLIKEISSLKDSLAESNALIEKHAQRIEVLSRVVTAFFEIKTLAGADEIYREREQEKLRLAAQLASIDTSSFDTLKSQIRSLKEELNTLEQKKNELIGKKGGAEKELVFFESRVSELELDYKEKSAAFIEFSSGINEIEEYRKYYDERTKQNDPAEILKNYETAIKNASKRRENLSNDFFRQTTQYNKDHNESLSGSVEQGDEVMVLLKKYRDTELPNYLERISRARKDAELQFRGDFVSRLSENITNAKENIRELNHTLKSISFGRDRYRFHVEEKPEKRPHIAVIRKAAEISRNANTLFESLSTPEDKKVVEDLFKTILEKELTSPEVLAICDYRKYFQYDIKMIDTSLTDEKSGKEIELSLSKVIREKSGGEAQTPYYVAIAASFLRFFRGGENTIRLALFDEAFNKMDDSRIGNTIDFFKKIGIQVITAVPTEKIETIAPFMDTTNLVIRHGLFADVREYRIVKEPDAAVHEE
jgi:uncharacterized protein YPO0396